MKLLRRQLLYLAALAFGLPAVPRALAAQAFPTRPIRIIVGFPPGGVGDITARLIGQALQERLGQSVIIENRPGAGGNVGAEAVVRAAHDGYTLTLAGPNNAINATLYEKLKFNFIADIAAVAGVLRGPLVMVVHPSESAQTVSEFIAYAKANSGKVNMASSGNGTSVHLAGELFKMMADVQMVHVPYRGEAPALTDLLAGQVQVMFANLPSAIGHIRTGGLRALAVTTADRSFALPDIPAVGDAVPGYEASGWFGVGAPKATPGDVIGILNKEINASLDDPKIIARIADLGSVPMRLSPEEFDAFIVTETEKWGKVVKFSGAKVD
jgi:tripartite-type tricarboxylate transporter receptor subunit TctC